MNPRNITIVLICLTVVVLGGWDVIAEAWGGDQATISRVIQSWANGHMIVAFAFGILMGHLFWPQPALTTYRVLLGKARSLLNFNQLCSEDRSTKLREFFTECNKLGIK